MNNKKCCWNCIHCDTFGGVCFRGKFYSLPVKIHLKNYVCEKFEKDNDNINSPAHYNQGKIETIDYIEDMNYLEGNIIKYISRYKYKNGVEDVKKAKWYIDRLIKNLEGENG